MAAVRGRPSGLPGLILCRFFQSAYSCHPLRLENEKWQLHFLKRIFAMFKPTPNPPETEDTTPYEFPGSKKFHEAAERALDHYFKPNALTLRFHKPSTMFQVAPDQDNESLLVHACESLAQASLMTSDIAAYIDIPQRRTVLAIQQIIMLAELAVNQVLDNHEIPQPPAHN
jgi:hypothetical protein